MNNSFEEYGTTWYTGKEPQLKAFTEGEKLGHTFYCHLDVTNGTIQSKAFGSYKDTKAFWKATKNVAPEEKAIYELIKADGPCKFFADLEWSLDWKSKDQIIEAFKDVINAGLENIDYSIDFDDMKIMDSCNELKNKGSLHITHPEVYFNNLHDQRRFWANIRTTMEKSFNNLFFPEETESNFITKTFIDFSVYTKNRAFRLPFSSKMKNHILERPLIPDEEITKRNIGDYIINTPPNMGQSFIDVSPLPLDMSGLGKRVMVSKKLLSHYAEKHGVELGEVKGKLITLKNKGVRICPINGEENKSDNAYFKIKGDKLYYCCHDENCRKKSLCIHTIQSDDIKDEIPWDEYNEKLQDVVTNYKSQMAVLSQQSYEWSCADDHQSNNEKQKQDLLKNSTKQYEEVKMKCLEDMNKYLCVIKGTAKPYFMVRQVRTDDLGINYVKYVRQYKSALRDSYENRLYYPCLINSKPGPKQKPCAWIDMWIPWVGRREYQEEVFQTFEINCPTTMYNTFNGFNISKTLANENGTSDVSHVVKFIKKAWCAGSDEVCNWVIDWFAHTIQKPLVKMHSAIVLRGEEGIGKGMIVQLLAKIMGPQHFEQPSSSEDILGKFTGIMSNKSLVFLDELVWGGDKQKAGILKKLITESKGTINEKFEPVRPFVNVFNLIMASNEEWVVPAGNNARRYMMLDVLNNHTDKEKDAVRLVCPYSFAKFLYDRDITNFKHDKIIATSGLANQKELSAPDTIKFILEQVRSKEFPFGDAITFERLFEQFKGLYTQDKYTTVQAFSKQVKQVINYTIYRPHGGKKHIKIPSEEDCRKTINEYFKQDMFQQEENLTIEEVEEELNP